MNKTFISLAAAAVLLVASCKNQETASDEGLGKPKIKVQDGRFTPEVMWSMGMMGEKAVSPDGSQMVYAVRYSDMAENKNRTDLYCVDLKNGNKTRRITNDAATEFSPVWMDNKTLLYCADNKIIKMHLPSCATSVVDENANGYEGFKLSPDGKGILYTATLPVKRPEEIEKLYAGLDKSTGRINEDLMYRHWDSWVDDYPHIFYAKFRGDRIDSSTIVDVLEGEPYECPMRPWGGTEQYTFSPDGKTIAYTCRKLTGKDYSLSTNSDIYLYDIETRKTRNVSEGIMGYDQNPVFSHDGTKLAWESMEHDGYESDKLRLMVLDLQSGERKDYTEHFDYGVSGIKWTDDDKEMLAVVMHRGTNEIFAFDVSTGAIRQVTHGMHDINGFELKGDRIYAQQASMSYPNEVYRYQLNANEQTDGENITLLNKEILDQCKMGRTEERWIKTTDGKDMLVWLVYPYNYDSTQTYPALLFCEGGPQNMVSQFWSTRWNFQTMSGAGYFVIAPNRRGCPGFGTEWCQEISGDYGGLCMKDYMQSVDVLAKEVKQIDPERIGACGASFGAFSIYWLAGHNEGHRFKAFLAHNGMFNFEQQCLETEEYWFTNWDLGGPYWEKNAKTAKSYKESPHRFVEKWNTPLCVVHSEFDFRIVASQGMAAYNAAKLRGLEARYLYFPDETHWVLKPQNSLLWH
ncbi:MAG: prolyl oligopeptidase family serine peptidase, partial [Bacteroidales bacterium]|nr:prolyl oligopeptidase family serine peptidase [Bacteroidales bacterium]